MRDSSSSTVRDHDYLRPRLIGGVVKHYDWGMVGHQSAIAQFVQVVDESVRYAELWFGAHPSGPSPVVGISPHTLLDLVTKHPRGCLGPSVIERFGNALPFLFKILSIRKALSIQVHPSKDQAAILHCRAPQFYPDSNHKPEIAIALSPVRLLFGFKTAAHLRDAMAGMPELLGLLSSELVAEISGATDLLEETHYRRCVQEICGASPERRKEVALAIKSPNESAPCAGGRRLFLELATQFELDDPGLFLALLLNEIELAPGQAIFTPAGILHAYLSGNLVECMANSDNVVRAGLTGKPVDSKALFEVATFKATIPAIIEPRHFEEGPGMLRFESPACEFEVDVIGGGAKAEFFGGCPAIVFCQEGEAIFSTSEVGQALFPGEALFVPAAQSRYELQVRQGRVFRVGVPR